MLTAATLLVAICCIAPAESQYCNSLDQYYSFNCPAGYYMYKVYGYHENSKEDRVYCSKCKDTGGNGTDNCYRTGYVNNYDSPVAVLCKQNHYFAGVRSEHSNSKEDRCFDFQCCSSGGKCTTNNCKIVGPVNKFDGYMSYTVDNGNVIVGAFSWHSNSKE